ncbi:MAG: peptidase C25 [Thermoplasmatales archaeon]|nr:MAG: peptidase C25 [Thermoplasmatales archaeon]
MKKVIPIIAVLILVLSGLEAVAISNDITYDANTAEKSDATTIAIPPFIIEESGGNYIEVRLKDVSSYLMESGKPMMPKIVKTVELPFGVRNVNVEVIPKKVQEYEIDKKICPSPALMPLNAATNRVAVKSKKVYASKELYPSTWYSYDVGCGLNADTERVTHVAIHIFPVRYSPTEDKLRVAKNADITITYEEPVSSPFPVNSKYDLVIIAPSKFADDLQRLVDHKNSLGVNTTLKTTEEIYDNFTGVDKPEQIKYFIKDAIESFGVKYVLLVGGLNSLIWAKPRDDANQGSKHWYVPVRYTNLYDDPKYPLNDESSLHDPGVISDLYYADVYKEGGVFEDWDPNGDGIFAAWGRPGVENDTGLDLIPDVALGRLACRNRREVKTVVDKIINYEENQCDPTWFKKMTVVSGDGFLDQVDLDFQWNTSELPDGTYTIYAESTNPDGISGPRDVINVTLDRSVKTNLTFNHDDHLRVDGYPSPPIAEIVTVSEGDILGNTDFNYTPTEGEAYCNNFNPWANMSYIGGVLHIRGKSYDPQAYGNLTDIHVWIKNEDEEVVFSDWRNDTEMYYEGEWTTGERSLFGRGGALYYMPEDFEKQIIWTSNGKFTGQSDVIKALSQGSGFAFLSGHGSPNVWSDHFPGVPGNRREASVKGLSVLQISPWFPFISFPVLPMNKLSNRNKLPVAVIGGCHNSQFNVSAIPCFLDILSYYFDFIPNRYMWTYGTPVPECFSWYLIRLPKRGAIATMGNTGLGYGMPGKACTTGGGDSWITIEFFKQYGAEGKEILGEAYAQTLTTYINSFDMEDFEAGHPKTIQQWVLLGDPSLKIGGYS